MLQVYDLDVWLRQRPTDHVLFVQTSLVGDVLVLVDAGPLRGSSLCLQAVERLLCVVPERAGA